MAHANTKAVAPRPAAGLPRGPVPLVGGGRPALRQGAAREPRAAPHRGHPDAPRRGRRHHAARRSSTGASWRWTSCSRRAATGSPSTGSPARRATRSTCTPRSASSTTCGPAWARTTSTGAPGRATPRSPAPCRTSGCPTATRAAPRDSFALRVRRELVAEHLGIRPTTCPTTPTRSGTSWRPPPTALDEWYAGGPARAGAATCRAPRRREGHLGALASPLRCVRPERRASSDRPGRLRRLSPPELTRTQLLWAPRLYDVFDPDGTVLRDDRDLTPTRSTLGQPGGRCGCRALAACGNLGRALAGRPAPPTTPRRTSRARRPGHRLPPRHPRRRHHGIQPRPHLPRRLRRAPPRGQHDRRRPDRHEQVVRPRLRRGVRGRRRVRRRAREGRPRARPPRRPAAARRRR